MLRNASYDHLSATADKVRVTICELRPTLYNGTLDSFLVGVLTNIVQLVVLRNNLDNLKGDTPYT